MRRRVRIAVRIAAGCGAVLLVLAFAARWHTDLYGVVSYPLSGVIVLGFLAGAFLVSFGAEDGDRRFMLGGGLLAAGAVALFLGVMCWWWWC